VFKKYPIDAVMHFAAFTYVGESVKDPQKYYLNNLRNTLNLLQVMLEEEVKYFVFHQPAQPMGTLKRYP